jgi:hypothetical protein
MSTLREQVERAYAEVWGLNDCAGHREIAIRLAVALVERERQRAARIVRKYATGGAETIMLDAILRDDGAGDDKEGGNRG